MAQKYNWYISGRWVTLTVKQYFAQHGVAARAQEAEKSN